MLANCSSSLSFATATPITRKLATGLARRRAPPRQRATSKQVSKCQPPCASSLLVPSPLVRAVVRPAAAGPIYRLLSWPAAVRQRATGGNAVPQVTHMAPPRLKMPAGNCSSQAGARVHLPSDKLESASGLVLAARKWPT